VSKGALVVRSAEGLQVEGSERITGIWYLEGVGYVLGTLEGSGDLHWTGPVDIDGTLSVNDDATLNAGLTLGSSGRIYVGPITLDPVGSGGQISSSGFLRLVAATGFQFQGNGTLTGNLGVTGSFSAGSKSFKIPHPLVPGAWLMHGSTESPVHGVEYWGDAVLDAGGSATVELPDYFEVLTQHEGRALFVTGRGFAADWTDIAAGVFTVSGPSGGRFSWLVKAARADVVFDPVTPMSADEAVAAVDEEDV
jgi:hypothetical protein